MNDPISAGLGLASWLLFITIAVIVTIALVRWRRQPAGAALMLRLSQRFAVSAVGAALGFSGPADGRRLVAQIVAASRTCVIDDFVLALENNVQPAGCLVLMLPAESALWVEEHRDLTLRIIDGALQDTLGEAYVDANAKSHPRADHTHRSKVREAARAQAPGARVSVRFLPTYASTVSAVFAGSVESATRLARRKHGADIPPDVRALEVPTVAPTIEAESLGRVFETISDVEELFTASQAPVPTQSYRAKEHSAPATRSFTGTPTTPYSPVSVLLNGQDAACFLRIGVASTVGRGPDNDVVTPADDLSVSSEHLVLTLQKGYVEVEALGRTGTWVSAPHGQQLLRAGRAQVVALPATITLGDARRTVVTIVETPPV